MTAQPKTSEGKLKRAITLPQLIFYGVGTMVGGGIYALTGKVAGEAAMAAPWAFLVAGAIAFLNVFTFSELSSRMPKSAGEAHYVSEAFGWGWLSALVGWLVILTGVVSAGTLSVATVGFVRDLVDLPQALGIVALVLAMGLLAAWGTGESVTAVVCITVIEVAALGYILVMAGENLADLPARWPEIMPGLDGAVWAGVLTGGFLALATCLGLLAFQLWTLMR